MLGDAAYDSGELREQLDERGTKPVIQNRSNRKQPFTFNKRLYKLRWRIETAFNRVKDFRRIATRYDRLARNYLKPVPSDVARAVAHCCTIYSCNSAVRTAHNQCSIKACAAC
jgi:transposase